MTIKNQKIKEFLEDVASSHPTPGGGAVAALTAATAASLVEMVCNLTIGKKNYSDVQKRVEIIARHAGEARLELLDMADADAEAFDKVMGAYKKDNKDEIKAALYWAIEVPQKVVSIAEEIQVLAIEVSKIGNKNAYSDAMSAEHLANAAIESALENVELNKKALASLGKD